MTIQIKNTQYFEWKVPSNLTEGIAPDDYDKLQQLIDEYFISDDCMEVEQISDDYYELEQVEAQ